MRQWKRIPKAQRGAIREGIHKHLAESDPSQTTKNKFRLRRPSEHAEFELRLEPWRIFYRVVAERVETVLIGEKDGGRLLMEGEEFFL